MQFNQVIAQEHIKEKLIDSVINSKISHAQLFLAAPGSGALPLALAYIQYIFCENKSGSDSCGECNQCKKSMQMIHPDIHYIFPVISLKSGAKATSIDYLKEWRSIVKSNPYFDINQWLEYIKAENKQGNINADECNEIVRIANLKTYESEYKVFIIWKAEHLGVDGNRLLKTLEEPNGKSLFILISESEDALLATVVSRTQIIKIPRLTDTDITKILIEKYNLSESEAFKLARFAEGDYNLVIKEMNNVGEVSEKLLQRWMKCSLNMDIIGMNDFIDEFVSLGREKQKLFIRYVLDFLRDVIVLQSIGMQHSRLREEEKATAQWIANKLNFEIIEQWIQLLERTHYHIERNANPKIQLMTDTLNLNRLINNKTIILNDMIRY